MNASVRDPDPQQALNRLFARTAHGIKPGLDVIRDILERLDNPHTGFLAIHVAGTNGKGSVCALIEAMLRAAGCKTGLYTSPHVIDFNERIRVNGRCISNAQLAALIALVEDTADALSRTENIRPATFFELSTAMAYEHFRRERVEIAVIETGMGGLWDATNVVDPLVSIITRIQQDHTDYLGSEISSIAREKAGIIKPGRPVLCGALTDEADAVIRGFARDQGAPFMSAPENISVSRVSQNWDGQKIRIEGAEASYGTVHLPLIGDHQLENCALAVGAMEVLGAVYSIETRGDVLRDGLASCRWPARCQVVSGEPRILVDAAHNPDGAAALAEVLRAIASGGKLGLIVGFLDDKDAKGFMKQMAGWGDRCWAVPLESDRSMPLDAVEAACREAGIIPECGALDRVWNDAMDWGRTENAMICAAGSIYLAGAILKREWGPGGVCRWFEGRQR